MFEPCLFGPRHCTSRRLDVCSVALQRAQALSADGAAPQLGSSIKGCSEQLLARLALERVQALSRNKAPHFGSVVSGVSERLLAVRVKCSSKNVIQIDGPLVDGPLVEEPWRRGRGA